MLSTSVKPIPPESEVSLRLSLHVLAWEAWAGPELSTREDWKAWADSGREWAEREPATTPAAPVSPMPPLLRRRADAADRLALETAFRLAPAGSSVPTVFATRHGQVIRSVSMMKAQAAGEPTSPMDFSLSVHNATAGQHSIAAGNRSPSDSLSSRGECFASALLEARGLVAEGHGRVLAVASDPCLPSVYRGRWEEEPAGYSLAVLLGDSGGDRFELSLSACAPGAGHGDREPQALAFLRVLAGSHGEASWSRASRRWTWSRA